MRSGARDCSSSPLTWETALLPSPSSTMREGSSSSCSMPSPTRRDGSERRPRGATRSGAQDPRRGGDEGLRDQSRPGPCARPFLRGRSTGGVPVFPRSERLWENNSVVVDGGIACPDERADPPRCRARARPAPPGNRADLPGGESAPLAEPPSEHRVYLRDQADDGGLVVDSVQYGRDQPGRVVESV